MPESSRRSVELINGAGLHLRAAGLLVQLASQFKSNVRVSCRDREADGRSMLELLLLAAECGTNLHIEASGPDADKAVAALCALVEARFHENEERVKRPCA